MRLMEPNRYRRHLAVMSAALGAVVWVLGVFTVQDVWRAL